MSAENGKEFQYTWNSYFFFLKNCRVLKKIYEIDENVMIQNYTGQNSFVRLSKTHSISNSISILPRSKKKNNQDPVKPGLIWDLGTENFVNYVGISRDLQRKKGRPTKKTESEILQQYNKLHINSVVITLLFGFFVIIFNKLFCLPPSLK